MRIVSWNMNQPGHGGSHHETWAFLARLDPDIALVQEALVPEDISGYQVLWTRAWDSRPWGSAILSRVGDLTLDWEDRSRGAVLVARCSIPSLGPVSIASVHGRLIGNRVFPALRETFDALRTHLGPRFIVGGDLNTGRAAALAWPKNGHAEFWNEIETWGFREPLPFNHAERQSYWREWLQNKPPTIGNSLQDDHIFLDAESIGYLTGCRVWDTREVRDLSDHGPLVVDLALPDDHA
jgi:exonuclease III